MGTQEQLQEQEASSREPEQQVDSHRVEQAEEWHTLCHACREHLQSLAPGDGSHQDVEPVLEVPPEGAQHQVMFMEEQQWRSFTCALERIWSDRHRKHFDN